MLSRQPSRLSLYAVVFATVLFVFAKVQQVFSVEPFIRESYALSWDNYGYYLHLPAVIIHHDPGLEDRAWVDSLNARYQKERPFYQVAPGKDNRLVNVYPVGWSIGYSPFFLMAHVTAGWFGYARDGLSAPYQWLAIIACLFYGFLGLWLLRKILLRFFNDRLTALLLLLIAFGTNLFHYATADCNLPHIFLFAVDNGILLLTIRWHERPKKRYALFIGLLLGLATITRPSEIVWALVPLLWSNGSFREKFRMLRERAVDVLLLIAGMIAVGSLQLVYWKYTSGHWFSFNHTEGFDFFRPFTWKVLFSYKKGWLLYTPLMIFAIAGMALLRKKKKGLLLPVLVFFLANLWFISSWECWWYAGTFSQRPFVQSYGMMALPLGVLLEQLFRRKIAMVISGALLSLCVLLNLFQEWQFNHEILHPELMTKQYYWKIFGKTQPDPSWRDLLEVDRGNLPPLETVKDRYTPKQIAFSDFEKLSEGNATCDTMGFQSSHSLLLDPTHDFGATFRHPYDEVSDKDHVRLVAEAEVFAPDSLNGKAFYFVFNMTGSRGQAYGYASVGFDSSSVKPGKWVHLRAEFITPFLLHRDDVFGFSIWNANGATLLIDNVRLTAYEPKEN